MREDLLKAIYVDYDEEEETLSVTKWYHSATLQSADLQPYVFLAHGVPGETGQDKVRAWKNSSLFQEYAHMDIVVEEQDSGCISGDCSD